MSEKKQWIIYCFDVLSNNDDTDICYYVKEDGNFPRWTSEIKSSSLFTETEAKYLVSLFVGQHSIKTDIHPDFRYE